MARIGLVDDVVVHQARGVQELDADRHMVQRLCVLAWAHASDDQRQRWSQAFARPRQDGGEHRPEHRIVTLRELAK
jgi:hypothetical protein